MSSSIDEFLDHIDQWKFKLHKRLKGLTPSQRNAFWNQVHESARARGLPVVEPETPTIQAARRIRRTGLVGMS